MNDDDLLRPYRPAGPPSELRARIMSMRNAKADGSAKALAERSSLRDWLPAVAAAGIIILFSALSYRVNATLDTKLAVPDDLRPVEQWGLSTDAGALR